MERTKQQFIIGLVSNVAVVSYVTSNLVDINFVNYVIIVSDGR